MNTSNQSPLQRGNSRKQRELQGLRNAEVRRRIELLEEERILREDLAEAWDPIMSRVDAGTRPHPALSVDIA